MPRNREEYFMVSAIDAKNRFKPDLEELEELAKKRDIKGMKKKMREMGVLTDAYAVIDGFGGEEPNPTSAKLTLNKYDDLKSTEGQDQSRGSYLEEVVARALARSQGFELDYDERREED